MRAVYTQPTNSPETEPTMKKTFSTLTIAILAGIGSILAVGFAVGLVAFLWLLWPVIFSLPVWLALKVLLPMFSAVKVTWLQAFCGCVIAKILRSVFSRTTTINNTTTKES